MIQHWYEVWFSVTGIADPAVFSLCLVVYGLAALAGLWELAFAIPRWVREYRSDYRVFLRRSGRWERRSRRAIRRVIRRTGGGW